MSSLGNPLVFATRNLALLAAICTFFSVDAIARDDEREFSISEPVFCKEVRGYRDFDRLEPARYTRDDKITIYCEPRGHEIRPVKDGKGYRAHVVTSGKVRKKGRKEVIFEKKELLDYDVTADFPPRAIYLQTILAIKNLRPGDYEFDLTVEDLLDDRRAAKRTVGFTVVASRDVTDPEAKPDAPEPPKPPTPPAPPR
ncbi:MAG: hypothetical protein SFX72_12550 [Isosphaeraceae bacterium]|nr:hypothetical protein [Isosphaeraceae bacterium]